MAKGANGNVISRALAVRHDLPQGDGPLVTVTQQALDPEAAEALAQYSGYGTDSVDHAAEAKVDEIQSRPETKPADAALLVQARDDAHLGAIGTGAATAAELAEDQAALIDALGDLPKRKPRPPSVGTANLANIAPMSNNGR